MKIDFKNFELYDGIDMQHVVIVDVRRVFADEMYRHGQGIAYHALALKIYNSQGEEDYSDEEYRMMETFSEQAMMPSFIDSLKRMADGRQGKEDGA